MNILSITQIDLKELENIFEKRNEYFNLKDEVKQLNKKGWDINNLNCLRTSFFRHKKELLNDIRNYLNTKNFPIAQLFENQFLTPYYVANTKELDFYKKELKSGYYPLNENIFKEICMKKDNYGHSSSFPLTLLQISTYCKNDDIAVQAFHDVLKNHHFKFTLENRQKIQLLWTNRFSSTSINLENYPDIEKFFSELNIEEKDYFSSKSGHYLEYSIDLDILSRKTNKSLNSVSTTARIIFTLFNQFIYDTEVSQNLSITDFTHEDNKFKIYFSNENNSPNMEKICIFLINSIDKFNTKEPDNKREVIINHYTTFFNHLFLEENIVQKKDVSKIKSKI